MEKNTILDDSKESITQRGCLDIILEKAISRKLLVFLSATGLLAWSSLDSETWGLIAICYIGGQSVIDAAKVWRHG
jgi:hypothetical protein|tara:strand:- start:6382 stop:6609 length:228 start_codon:yes stop_codon:yes gene_type:complete